MPAHFSKLSIYYLIGYKLITSMGSPSEWNYILSKPVR